MTHNSYVLENRFGIVLSGGDGTRLGDFVHRIRGDSLPKQYNNFTGKRSMLEHTLHRAETLIQAQRLFVVITRRHLKFDEVRRQIGSRPLGTVVIQPENKDTAPGVLLPLLYLSKQSPEAVLALFPSDHFIGEEDLFMCNVERAFRVVESDRSRIVLLGTEPYEPDPEYGYIIPGEEFEHGSFDCTKRVELFVEKPASQVAARIIRAGALWNTLVMVFKLETLLAAFQRRTPKLYRSFQAIAEVIGTPDEQPVLERVYRTLEPINFSKALLQSLPYDDHQSLAVLPVPGVTWSDLGTPVRLSSALQQLSRSNHAECQRT